MAEKYWKVLLAVIFCNTKDKNLTIYNWCAHEDHDHRKVVDWSFTKNEYKQYQNVANPGTVIKFVLVNSRSKSYSDTFYNAPIWKQVAIEHMTISLIDLWNNEVTKFADIPFKCVRLRVTRLSIRDLYVQVCPSGPWTYFSNSEKLEICFEHVNERAYTNKYNNILKLVKHPNLHVVLESPIRVRDAKPRQTRRDQWYGREYWTLFDVENFVNQIAVLSIKSLTYKLSRADGSNLKSPTVTFNCDENFPFSFMDFLKTQRVYC